MPAVCRSTRRALAALHRLSGGNIYALRLRCSTIMRIARDRPGYSPLARLEVTRRMVMRAADDIAETGITFRPHVEGWLDQGERIVLQHIARGRPRSPRSIRHALEDATADIRIGEALDGLERMQLIERRGRRHRVRVPLFERWINIHLEAPAQLRRARKQAQLRWLALGTTLVTLLGIAYWTWLRSTRTPEPAVLDDCTFELDHPDRVGTDETIVLNVFQECKTPTAPRLRLGVEAQIPGPTRPRRRDPWSHSHVTPALRVRDLLVLAALASGCGWLPPDHAATRPAPPDPDAAVIHGWKVTGQVLGPRALISEADAAEFRDRTVEVSAAGYSSPWSGACGEARREKQPRALAEVAATHELDRAARLGLVEPIVEYQLLCITNRTPPLILYVAGPHAVTCWSGVCYLLGR